jgi:hypothetical protein
MEIAHTSPPLMAVIRLDFTRPFQTQNIVEFTLRPEGSSTSVSWAMRGANPYIAKLIQLVINTDRLLGKDFETGLASLKALTEKQDTDSMPPLASQVEAGGSSARVPIEVLQCRVSASCGRTGRC